MFSKLFSFLGVHSPAYTVLTRLFSGASFVGKDEQGNKYYTAKARAGYKRARRWVMYNGEVEASRVPPEWHGWLHHQTDVVPHPDEASFRRSWQVPHQKNMTGTNLAYRPPGHILNGAKRPKTTGDYEAWSPED